jgi:hypothetical protein
MRLITPTRLSQVSQAGSWWIEWLWLRFGRLYTSIWHSLYWTRHLLIANNALFVVYVGSWWTIFTEIYRYLWLCCWILSVLSNSITTNTRHLAVFTIVTFLLFHLFFDLFKYVLLIKGVTFFRTLMTLYKCLVPIKSLINLSLKTFKNFILIIITELNTSISSHVIHHLVHVDNSWRHFCVLLRWSLIIYSYIVEIILTTHMLQFLSTGFATPLFSSSRPSFFTCRYRLLQNRILGNWLSKFVVAFSTYLLHFILG